MKRTSRGREPHHATDHPEREVGIIDEIDSAIPYEYETVGTALYRVWLTSERTGVPRRASAHKRAHDDRLVMRELLCRHPGEHTRCIERAEGRSRGDDVPDQDVGSLSELHLNPMNGGRWRNYPDDSDGLGLDVGGGLDRGARFEL